MGDKLRTESNFRDGECPCAILAGFIPKGEYSDDPESSYAELVRLADTAGATVAAIITQPKTIPTSQFMVGSGKVREIAEAVEEFEADMVIFNHELTPLQFRNLERELGVLVLDRTQLILDIFAMRAQSNEGKIQVELAQLQYLLPRITGQGVELSRLGGGIGTRGPGETKLETDRRKIRERISTLKKKLVKVEKTRKEQKRSRQKAGIPLVALVGYTNAGKTTLFNRLASEKSLAEDKLFATLDPITRKIFVPGCGQALITDTVGFIRELPVKLVESFKSTLEGIVDAHLLVHVVDVANPRFEGQMEEVRKTVASLDASHIPVLTVFNKADMPLPDNRLERLSISFPYSISISAAKDKDFAALSSKMAESLPTKKYYDDTTINNS